MKYVNIYSKGRNINNANDRGVLITDAKIIPHMNVFDGEIGFPVLKGLAPKVILDFDNMKIEGRD